MKESENGLMLKVDQQKKNESWDGIHQLPGRWEKIVTSDGQYFDH